jgi:hypothetical protein
MLQDQAKVYENGTGNWLVVRRADLQDDSYALDVFDGQAELG